MDLSGVHFVKRAEQSPLSSAWVPGGDEDQEKVQGIVRDMLKRIEAEGEKACLDYARKLDKYEKDTVIVSPSEVDELTKDLDPQVKDDIEFLNSRVGNFARETLKHMQDFECELFPGVITGQKLVPVETVGCYVPGGRYSYVASAIMSICTAKVAGVKNIIAACPPKPDGNIHPGTLYAMKVAGADTILSLGGVQGVGALAFGLFTGHEADMIVGPGNKFVAEAKRFLFGRVGIDLFAGPTEIAVLADDSADPFIVATDLVSQAEHGVNSPAWLITDSEALANKVNELVPECIKKLPEDNAANVSWPAYGEIIVVKDRKEMAKFSDRYAAEHLEVQCEDLDWWLENLTNYGSLFLGEGATVTYGDKASGPNHTLPTKRVSRYSGGLSVDKYMKKLTWQKLTKEGNREIAVRAARISRLEGMEAHARAGDARLEKYFPGEKFDLSAKI